MTKKCAPVDDDEMGVVAGSVVCIIIIAAICAFMKYHNKTVEKPVVEKPQCQILRENDIPIKAKTCIKMADGSYTVVTMTEVMLGAHASRIEYLNEAVEKRKLLKPYIGDR